jgi:hypothetical protein
MGRGDPRDDENEKLVAAADFDGPTRHRRFTDLFCLLLLFAMWIGMTILGSFAMANGDYRLVVYPLDYNGNICGTDFTSSNNNNNDTQKKTDMTDYPYLYYINSYGGGVCVKDCPVVSEYGNGNGSNSVNLTDIYTLVTYNGIWQVAETNETTGNWIGATLPTDFIQVGDYSASPDALSCTKELCYPNNDPTQSWTSPGIQKGFGFAYYAADTYELLWRCYYTDAAINAIETIVNANATDNAAEAGLDNAYDQAYQFWNKLYADLAVSWKYILGFGFGLSVGISFIYVFMMRIPLLLTAVIWASIFGSIAMLTLAGFYAGRQADEWYNEEPRTVDDRTITVRFLYFTRVHVVRVLCVSVWKQLKAWSRWQLTMKSAKLNDLSLKQPGHEWSFVWIVYRGGHCLVIGMLYARGDSKIHYRRQASWCRRESHVARLGCSRATSRWLCGLHGHFHPIRHVLGQFGQYHDADYSTGI